MNNKIFSILLLFLAAVFNLSAQEGFRYVDASQFPLYGKVSDATKTRYERLPASLENVVRDDVWYLGRHSAGLYVRFRTDSKAIRLRWESTFNVLMGHMTPTGTRGLDLYAFEEGRWIYAGSARPVEKKTDALVISGMDGKMREYMLYLSLYDGVSSLEIGVGQDAAISLPQLDSPLSDSPVVMYGTSILQGGCANRPGMAHTNIIARELGREVINLGFSGNALLDYEIAELMASVSNPALYVLDYVPNASAEMIDTKGEKFFRIIRDAHPDVPVIFVEDPIFPKIVFDSAIRREVEVKNIAQKALFERLKSSGEKKIYYVSAENMIGDDGEATVDGLHLTDLGAMRYVRHIMPVIRAAIDGPLFETDVYSWFSERVDQGNFTAYAESESCIKSTYPAKDGSVRQWKRKNDISAFGDYSGASVLETALYNMAADELVNNFEADSTLRTGALWGGVWTRDVSYSIVLSLAALAPRHSEISLMRKVDRLGRIIQDTGTGGSWPCSSDRIVWALGAWSLYCYTGDEQWLANAYEIIEKSIAADENVVYDGTTGLFKGESSFIDWRQQSYPEWMQPADICVSECLGTNAVYYSAYKVLQQMALRLGKKEKSAEYAEKAEKLKEAVNANLWMEDRGYYGQYLYGRNGQMLSPRSETLGESLAILSGIASPSKAVSITENMPVAGFGPTIFWPQIGEMPPYHNNASWPFVTSYYAMAAAKAGNQEAVLHAIGSNVRAAAVFATNHENFVSADGGLDTQMNSHNMLWSIAGMLGIYHKILLGMEITPEGIAFSPFVPEKMSGTRSLKNFRFRDMVLDIEVSGYGEGVKSCYIDGAASDAFISSSLSGKHKVKIELDGKFSVKAGINSQKYSAAPATPIVQKKGNSIVWESVDGAVLYHIYKNGSFAAEVDALSYEISNGEFANDYQVIAVNGSGITSFASEPVQSDGVAGKISVPLDIRLDAEWHGRGGRRALRISVNIPQGKEGTYALVWKYANGNGDVTDRNMCATRSIYVDGSYAGTSVFPQRGFEDWTSKGASTMIKVRLTPGKHKIEAVFSDNNINMNIDVNSVHLYALELIPTGE